MTTERPELIIEGSENKLEWDEIHFKWKAGKLDNYPKFVQPHHPRLDWQMWFAALFFEQVDEIYWQVNSESPKTLKDHTQFMNRLRVPVAYHWFYKFLEKVLEGSPDVLKLLDSQTRAPKYIRVWLYNYHFSDFKIKNELQNWWIRDNKRILIPAFQLEDIK